MQDVGSYIRAVGVHGFVSGIFGKFTGSSRVMRASDSGLAHPVWLRVPSSDIWAYEQIFLKHEYAFDVSRPPRVIIDAGANIGLAAVYFANRFPDCVIVAIEPEAGNYELLCRNVERYPNIRPLQAAVWHKNEKINLVDPHRGKWAFRTQALESSESNWGTKLGEIDALTVDEILKRFNLDRVDVLKVDIEGAEVEVFGDTSRWLDRVDSLIVELHERIRRGCNRAFYLGSNGFDNEWLQGENVYVARHDASLRQKAKRP